MSSVSTSASRFIAPYVATMDASGAADYVYVQQENISIAGIDYEFDVTLSTNAMAIKLLDSFTVSGNGVNGNLNVSLTNITDFQEVLRAVINGAEEASRNNKTATTQLETDLHAGLYAAISGDELINSVQNLDVTGVEVTIDASGGASDMAGNMNDERCRLIYTQIPFGSRVGKYYDASENQTTSALPLLAGDILSFVFDVDVSDVVPVKTQTDINTSADPNAVTSGQVNGNFTSSLHYNLASKRIVFNITMPGTAGEEIEGLKA